MDLSLGGGISPTEALLAGVESAAIQVVASSTQVPGVEERREGFRIGTLNLMVRYEDGNELAELPTVCRLPHAPAWFLGMTNLHGSLLPVFDMAGRWNTVHASDTTRMLLVLGHADERAGLVIDGLPIRLRFGPQDKLEQAATPAAFADCAGATYRLNAADWIDVNCTALLERLQRELLQ